MIHFNTQGNDLKRGMLRFADKISKGFHKPARKFIADMIYGIIASGSCKLTGIGRALKEDISLKKVVERLGRNLVDFSEKDAFMANYLAAVRPSLGDDTMLLIDPSDVTKPCSPKMEAIGSIYDASKKRFAEGYWTIGAAALTEQNHQPIPVYEELYPCTKQGGQGLNAEIKNTLQYLREHFSCGIPRVCDRGLDTGEIIKEFYANNEKFILRVNQNRIAVHGGYRTKIEDITRALDCRHELKFHSKTGNISTCKIGMTKITLPKLGNLKLNLVVCKEFGEKPLVLYTNLDEPIETFAVRVVKAYLMRWRIDEMYAFKKQSLNFEDFRVRSLAAIKMLDLFLTVAVGYIGLLSSKVNDTAFVAELICASKRIPKYSVFMKTTKFFYYAVHDGITFLLDKLCVGISHFFASPPVFSQLCFTLP